MVHDHWKKESLCLIRFEIWRIIFFEKGFYFCQFSSLVGYLTMLDSYISNWIGRFSPLNIYSSIQPVENILWISFDFLQALLSVGPSFHGRFIFWVSSTGLIVCKISEWLESNLSQLVWVISENSTFFFFFGGYVRMPDASSWIYKYSMTPEHFES